MLDILRWMILALHSHTIYSYSHHTFASQELCSLTDKLRGICYSVYARNLERHQHRMHTEVEPVVYIINYFDYIFVKKFKKP
jgi:hypothetical protein